MTQKEFANKMEELNNKELNDLRNAKTYEEQKEIHNEYVKNVRNLLKIKIEN